MTTNASHMLLNYGITLSFLKNMKGKVEFSRIHIKIIIKLKSSKIIQVSCSEESKVLSTIIKGGTYDDQR